MSTSGPRLSRLMTMVPWLMTHDGVTIQETADHFGISTDQCEKDLWLLVVCGLPGHMPDQLVDIQFWDDGRIHVIDPQTLDRPLRLSGDEVMSMLIALRLLAQVPGTHDREVLYGLIHRLEHYLSQAAIGAVLIDSGVRASVLITIEQALENSALLELVYASGTDDVVTARSVQPIGVRVDSGFTYLEAYCLQAEAVRTFRLDRILEATMGSPVSVPESALSTSESVAMVAEVEIQEQARWVMDLVQVDAVTQGKDGKIHGEIVYRDLDWLIRIVLSAGGALQVTGPTSVRAEVAAAAKNALSAYS